MGRKRKHPSYLPETLQVSKKEYQVLPRSKSWFYKNKAFGTCCFEEKEIKVAITEDKLENLSTLAHEFAHAYINEYNIKANKKWTEENLVLLFENIFIKFYTQLDK